MASREPTIAACATAAGGQVALLRLSGPAAGAIAAAAGVDDRVWHLAHGACPVRILRGTAPATATGHDLIEILLPGSTDLVELALAALLAAGAEQAGPGAFTRQAVATGKLSLERAEALLALAQAGDAAAAAEALARLRGALSADLEPLRQRLIAVRAQVEAGLDFLDEHDVRSFDPQELTAELARIAERIARWRVAAHSTETEPLVCLVGRANAGKSALYAALSGEPALVSPIAGTTRDQLEARLTVDGVAFRLIDTAGWLEGATGLDAAALQVGSELLAHASLVLACAAPDAPLPGGWPADGRSADGQPADLERMVVIATKADLGLPPDPRAVVQVSVADGRGLTALRGLIARRIAPRLGAAPRQQRLLAGAAEDLRRAQELPPDELLADDLRRAATRLAELLGVTTDDHVLDAVFARFCIGK